MKKFPAFLNETGRRRHHYKKGDLIYTAGSMPRYVYFIQQGKVKMVTVNAEGREFIQGIFSGGEYFGEPALLVNKAYLANTVALEDTSLFKVSADDFFALIKHDPDFTIHLVKVLSNRLFYKSMMLEEIANEHAAHSLMTLLRHLALTLAKGDKINITRAQLADMTGLRVETVIRTLKELAAEGKICLSAGKIIKTW